MSPRESRVGVVGCGHWGQNIVRDLVALGARVTVADCAEAGRARAHGLGVERVVSTTDALPPCDGYVVATPAPAHRAVVERLLETQVPIFVEKPPCNDITAVRALAAAAGDRVYVMHKWRHHAGVEALAGLVRDGALGAPHRLETVRTGPDPLPSGTDVTWHLAVHDLSIALEVLGSVPEARHAVGVVNGDGRIGRCEATLETEAGIDHHLIVATGDPARCRSVRLVGSEGAAVLADAYDDHLGIDRAGRQSDHPIGTVMPLARELQTFLEHLVGGPPPKSSLTDALAVCEQVAQVDALVRATVTPA